MALRKYTNSEEKPKMVSKEKQKKIASKMMVEGKNVQDAAQEVDEEEAQK